jgi:hypothetical protein
VIAHALLAGVNSVRPIIGISAHSTVGLTVLRDRSVIAKINAKLKASRIIVHLQIARVVYLMRARRAP